MQKIEIQSAYREKRGKGPARQLRFAGQVPAVLYSKGGSTLLRLNPKEIDRVLNSSSGENSLITLLMSEGKSGSGKDTAPITDGTVAPAERADPPRPLEQRLAILREVQRDPLTEKILHVDLFEVAMNEPIVLRVPVEMMGASIGVKNGGILQHSIRELEIRCLPSVIPDRIRIDVSALKIGDSIHVKEISLTEGIEMFADPNQSVVSVVPPISEAKMEAMLAAGPKEVKEPEVIGQKEKEEEGKAEGKAKGKEEAKPKGKEEGKK